MTFIDHENKTAVKASDLGKGFNAKTILATFSPPERTIKQKKERTAEHTHAPVEKQPSPFPTSTVERNFPDRWTQDAPSNKDIQKDALRVPNHFNPKSPHLLTDLLEATSQSESLPKELSQDKKKKRRKRQSR